LNNFSGYELIGSSIPLIVEDIGDVTMDVIIFIFMEFEYYK
jgi:hypothetical protein